MAAAYENLLYRRPDLYEVVYHGADHAVPRMCGNLFETHLGHNPESLLDVGCGTGRDYGFFSALCREFVGVDYQAGMLDYARKRHPDVDWRIGDMRSLDLGRRFEAIVCLGLALNYMHTNDDLTRAIATFARHTLPDALLVLEVINAIVDPGGSQLPHEFVIDTPDFEARATAVYRPLRRQQLLSRRRAWLTSAGETIHDSVEFRMLFPAELEYHLSLHGFSVVGMFDNTDLMESDLTGSSLYVAARFNNSPRSDTDS